jgi:hypothetical protein
VLLPGCYSTFDDTCWVNLLNTQVKDDRPPLWIMYFFLTSLLQRVSRKIFGLLKLLQDQGSRCPLGMTFRCLYRAVALSLPILLVNYSEWTDGVCLISVTCSNGFQSTGPIGRIHLNDSRNAQVLINLIYRCDTTRCKPYFNGNVARCSRINGVHANNSYMSSIRWILMWNDTEHF